MVDTTTPAPLVPTVARGAPPPRKIAVLRASAVGDFIFGLPALDALREAFPRAEIVVLGRAWHAAFLNGRHGPIDRVITVPPWSGVTVEPGELTDPEAIARFVSTMQKEAFDLAIQLHGGGRHSNRLVLSLGAALTAGTRTPDAPLLDQWVPYVYSQSEVLRALEVVALVGARVVTVEPRLSVTAADLAEAAVMAPADARPLVALHPGASAPERRWPPERFAAVGDALAGAGARVVVTGTTIEAPLAAMVTDAMHHPATNLAGRLTLGGLAGLQSRCAVVVANDTGPLHLAGAVGAATVGLYWGFNLVTAGPTVTSRHRPFASWQRECPTCGADLTRTRCDHRVSLVSDIDPVEVAAAALELLDRGRDRASHRDGSGTSTARAAR
jgi:ADP-heptose:LPS heptosyltransferase